MSLLGAISISIVAAAALALIVSRFIAMYPIFAFLQLDTRTAGVVAINLGQISEFSLVIFALGINLGHVSHTAASLILYTVLLTSVLSTYGILFNHALASWLAGMMERMGLPRWLGATAPPSGEKMSHGMDEGRDLFLLGVSREGLALVEHLDRNAPDMKQRIVAVDFNPETLQRLQRYGVEHYYGDIANAETLRHAGIERAAVVISGISDWFLKGTTNLQLLYEVRGLTSSARIVLTADSPENAQQLYAAGADYVMVPQALTAEHLYRVLCDSSPNALTKARELQTSALFRRS